MSEQQPKEYIITEAGMNTAIALLKAAGRYDDAIYVLGEIRPAPSPENPCIENGCTDIENCDEICEHSRIFSPAWVKKHDAAIRREERERVQPFVDLLKVISTKRNEMQDIMRRNKIVINNVQEPMQKLAFTFYSEIGELAHMAGVVLEEYEESLREGAK